MAVCDYCHQEMLEQRGCTIAVETIRGQDVKRIPFGQGTRGVDDAAAGDHCHDCWVPRGSYHHPGCDADTCGICGGQAISCGCDGQRDDWDNGDDEGNDDDESNSLTGPLPALNALDTRDPVAVRAWLNRRGPPHSPPNTAHATPPTAQSSDWGQVVRDTVVLYLHKKWGREAIPERLVSFEGRDREICEEIGDIVRQFVRRWEAR